MYGVFGACARLRIYLLSKLCCARFACLGDACATVFGAPLCHTCCHSQELRSLGGSALPNVLRFRGLFVGETPIYFILLMGVCVGCLSRCLEGSSACSMCAPPDQQGGVSSRLPLSFLCGGYRFATVVAMCELMRVVPKFVDVLALVSRWW